MHSVALELLVIALLLVINGLFALAEIALVSSRKSRLKTLAEKGNPRAHLALAQAENPTKFLSTVQFGVTLSGIAAGAFSGAALARELNHWLIARFPAAGEYSEFVSFGGVVLGITFFTIVLGELVPKRLGLANPERWSIALARPMHVISRLAAPFVWLLTVSTDGVAKLLGSRAEPKVTVSDEEVASLIEQGLHAGVFHKAEKAMVEGVMALDRCQVTALMTPRPKLVWLNIDDPDEANWRKIVASGHSTFPVYQKHRDNVLGMVHIKALWAHAAFSLPTNLRNLLTPATLIPEHSTAIQVLEQFKKTGKHTALVVDEFGGVQGMITLIDILEAIVGDLPDQLRRAQPEAKRREDGSWLVDATLAIPNVKELLKLRELPGEDTADFQTLGGFVVTQLGRIPAAGDYFDWNGWRFEVMDMDRQRVDKVLLARTPASTATAEQASA
ncbi:hemolysin family protein [Oleiharenicola sp. Vm1]|uniref:hemolysin family protein n=1 Tax=Oleiharenicola sp. Vm1 TaxID=3398393 RepID=UPI0039F44F89